MKVAEEIGYDIGGMAQEKDFVESIAGGQRIKLYIVPGVPESATFETQTRKEISVRIFIFFNHILNFF